MNFSVSDDVVREYADRLRRGEKLGEVFPAKMSECNFTPEQRDIIRSARREKEALVKSWKLAAKSSAENATASPPPGPPKNPPQKQPPSPPKNVQVKQPPQPNPPKKPPAKAPHNPAPPRTPGLSKLEKMLYLQHGKCFFCGEPLAAADANIEHLHPISLGGQRVESNEVVCHRSLNEAFGDMNLKEKIKFILRAAGQFRCPKGK